MNKFEEIIDDLQSGKSREIIFLCETWLKFNDPRDFHIPGYICINYPRTHLNTKAKRGSGGVMLFIEETLGANIETLNNSLTEDRIWIRIPQILSKPGGNDIYFCFCYIAPANSIVMCNEASQWATFEKEVVKYLSKGEVIICGDLNARTGNMQEFSMVHPILEEPWSSRVNIAISRKSKDIQVNAQGRCLLDMCVSSGMRIVNGRHHGDRNGEYTCHTPRGSSVVDYVVVSSGLFDTIESFCVDDLPLFTDHCPLRIDLNVKHNMRTKRKLQHKEHRTQPIMSRWLWSAKMKEDFLQKLKNNEDKLQKIDEDMNMDSPQSISVRLLELLVCLSPVKRKVSIYQPQKKCFPRKGWFDDECKKKKRIVNDAKRAFLLDNTAITKSTYFVQKRE